MKNLVFALSLMFFLLGGQVGFAVTEPGTQPPTMPVRDVPPFELPPPLDPDDFDIPPTVNPGCYEYKTVFCTVIVPNQPCTNGCFFDIVVGAGGEILGTVLVCQNSPAAGSTASAASVSLSRPITEAMAEMSPEHEMEGISGMTVTHLVTCGQMFSCGCDPFKVDAVCESQNVEDFYVKNQLPEDLNNFDSCWMYGPSHWSNTGGF